MCNIHTSQIVTCAFTPWNAKGGNSRYLLEILLSELLSFPFHIPGFYCDFCNYLSCLTTNAIVKKLFFTYKSLLFLWIMWITLCITIKCRKSVPLFVDNFVRFWDYICLRTCVLRQVVTHFPTCRWNRHCFLRRHSQFVKNAAFCVLPVWREKGAASGALREIDWWGFYEPSISFTLPASTGSARKNQSVRTDGKPDFVCLHAPPKHVSQSKLHHIRQNCRL